MFKHENKYNGKIRHYPSNTAKKANVLLRKVRSLLDFSDLGYPFHVSPATEVLFQPGLYDRFSQFNSQRFSAKSENIRVIMFPAASGSKLIGTTSCAYTLDFIGNHMKYEWYRLPIVDGEIPEDYATFTD